MRFSFAAALLALACAANASTQSRLVAAEEEILISKGAANALAKSPKSKLNPAGIPSCLERAVLAIEEATTGAKDHNSVTPDCDSSASQYNKLSDSLGVLTPKVIGLACDVRFTSEVKLDITKYAQQLKESIDNLEPQFEEYCPEQSVFPSQTETNMANLQLIADAFEQPCDA